MTAVSEGRALGCALRVVVTEPAGIVPAALAVDGVMSAIDETCSRFRDDSELSRIAGAHGRPVSLSPLLATAIELALRAAEITDGAVDPTVGRAVRLAGYDRDFAGVPAEGGPLRLVAERVPGWRSLRYEPGVRALIVPPGVEIDLGATAKGLAADLAAAAAAAALSAIGAGGVLVSIGGDIATAGTPPPGGWRIQVSEDSGDPIAAGREAISVGAAGVATSSTTVRTWMRGGTRLHHLIDPRDGLPAAGPWRTATVVAASCADANIAATAAIVKGIDAPAWLLRAGVAARLVGTDGRVARIGGWPEPADGLP